MLEERLAALEDEVKVLNNEIKQVLLDIREEVIARFQNPLPEFETGPLDKDIPRQEEMGRPPAPSAEAKLDAGSPLKEGADLLDPAQAAASPGVPAATPGGAVILDATAPLSGASPSTEPEKWVPGKALIANDPMNVNAEAAVMDVGKTFEEEDAVADGSRSEDQVPEEPEKGENEMEINADTLEAKKNGNNGTKGKATAVPEAGRAEVVGARPDLLTVATLSRWLTNGMKQVGRERMEAVIDIYEAMGGISPELKEILLRLLRIHDGEGAPLSKTMSVLLELDNLQTRNRIDKTEAAVLSLFLNGNGRKEVCHR